MFQMDCFILLLVLHSRYAKQKFAHDVATLIQNVASLMLYVFLFLWKIFYYEIASAASKNGVKMWIGNQVIHKTYAIASHRGRQKSGTIFLSVCLTDIVVYN